MNNANILLVDDDHTFSTLMGDVLQFAGFNVTLAGDGESALKLLESQQFDLALLDILLPDINGVDVLQKALALQPDLTVIMISGGKEIKPAVDAIKHGAYDYIEKPLDAQRLLLTVRNTLEALTLKRKRDLNLQEAWNRYGMIGESPAMRRVFALVDALAPTKTPILITGESGTGKELVAQALHKNSKRANAPFIKVNCAAIPDTLVESELFGHEKGAFTDARSSKKGLFQLAHSGTLFLDEIGDLSPLAQAKVLTAIEDGKILRVGAERYEAVDVRIISATNKPLEEKVTNGQFRKDLFYRINVVPIHLPPLRERSDDISALAIHFLKQVCQEEMIAAKELLPDAQIVLKNQLWESNVRGLANCMRRLAVLAEPRKISGRMIQNVLKFNEPIAVESSTPTTLREARQAFERSYIQSALAECSGNVSKTAEILGIERSHLYRKMEQLGIKAGD